MTTIKAKPPTNPLNLTKNLLMNKFKDQLKNTITIKLMEKMYNHKIFNSNQTVGQKKRGKNT